MRPHHALPFTLLLLLPALAPPLALADAAPALPTAVLSVTSDASVGDVHLGDATVTLTARAGEAPLTRLEIWDHPVDPLAVAIAVCHVDSADEASCEFRETKTYGGSGELAERVLRGYAYDAAGNRAEAKLTYLRADSGAFRLLWG